MMNEPSKPSPEDLGYKPLSQIVGDKLRERILAGHYPPGARLSITALAKSFGVSAVPVREALRNLESLGLIDFAPNIGVTVRALTAAEVRELYLIRTPLEILAATEAMRRVTPAALDDLAQLVRDMDAPRGEWLDLHDRFHKAIYELSELPLLRDWLTLLRDRMRPYRLIHLYNLDQRAEAQAEHHLYIDAFRRRDDELLRTIIPRHLMRSAIIGGYAETDSGKDV